MTAPWPGLAADAGRLAEVHDLRLLDTPAEERFDRITRMASRVLAVPIAAVTLVEVDRQWVKSAVGVPPGEWSCQGSISAYVVANDHHGVLSVEDLSQDPRFANLTLGGQTPAIGGYAGHVLRVRGKAVGTLCVMDHHARRFTPDEEATLADLAQWAQAELRSDAAQLATRRLDALQRRTEMVLAGMAEGVIGVNTDGVVTFANAAAHAMLRWPGESLIGQDLHAETHEAHGADPSDELCPVTAVLKSGVAQRGLHSVFWRHDGSALPADWSVGPVHEDGAVVGAVVVFDDASSRLEVDQIKEDFAAVVSHELRTPLTSLRGAIDLLDRGVMGGVAPEARPLLDIAVRNSHRLGQLVDDILDVERLARREMPLTFEVVNVAGLMRTAAATVLGTAFERDIRIDIEPCTGQLRGDEHRLVQVLTNLLGNALRFSATGSRVVMRAEQDNEAVRLSVIDHGVGIPENALGRVFDRFWQVDASARRQQGGSGLGLTIAKSIVEAHGGWIVVTSEVGVGTTFTVCLPHQAATDPSSTGTLPAPDPVTGRSPTDERGT